MTKPRVTQSSGRSTLVSFASPLVCPAFQWGWLVAGLVLVLGVALPVQAYLQEKNYKPYGEHCATVTYVNEVTDEETYQVRCYLDRSRASRTPYISISVSTLTRCPELELRAGPQPVVRPDPLPVLVSVGDRSPVIRRANESHNLGPFWAVVIYDHTLIDRLIAELPHGQHVYIQVGAQYALIPIDGVREAFDDFIRRIRSSVQP